jgi:GDP-4-dehydro-6-deoxy-D-mannose reductase
MRVLVTGAQGFVGGWLLDHLRDMDDEAVAPKVDVTDFDAMAAAVREARPGAIYHLAALTHVGESWMAPAETFRVNAMGTLSVLEAARAIDRTPRVLIVGSAEMYGGVRPDELPLTESSPLRPATPYAVSKVAAEYLGVQAWLGYGVPVLRVRPFNHVGPGQSERFVVSSIAKQIVEAEREGATVLRVGNLSARRDYTDVRDVARAYRLLVERGTPGEVYQVCSGVDLAVREIAERMLALSKRRMTLQVDPALVRPIDVPALRGDPSKLESVTGWRPRIDLDATLADTLDWWRANIDTVVA